MSDAMPDCPGRFNPQAAGLELATGLPIPEQPTTRLADFLRRYDELATEGVFDGPRYRIRYSRLGQGHPLYVVTGISSTRRLLAPLLVELAASFQVTVYSLAGVERGDGASLKKYSLEDYPADLLSLAEHLGDRRFDVVANSFGVSIALRAMASQPDRIGAAMLAAGFVRRPLFRRERWLAHLLRHWPGRLGNLPLLHLIDRYNHGRELAYRDPALLPFFISETGRLPVRTVAAQVLAVDETDVGQFAADAAQPTLVVHGAEDRLIPPRCSGELAKLLRNVRIMIVPRCGHLPFLSHPELLAHAAERFFREAPEHHAAATVGH